MKIFVLLGLVTSAFAYADEINPRETTTSQRYVDVRVSGLQDKIPATTGDKVVMPTGTQGVIGEREIKTNLGEETNQSDTAITTVGTVKTAVNAKQNKISGLNSQNILTYTGTTAAYTDNDTSQVYGPGMVTTTPIYNNTVNTYANGLVRASTLNSAVANGAASMLTQVDNSGTESNTGTLWRINTLNSNVLPTTAYLPAHIAAVGGRCYNPHTLGNGYQVYGGNCSGTLRNSLKNGDWGVVFPYETGIVYETTCGGAQSSSCGKEIQGISVCSNVTPGVSTGGMVTNASKVAALNQEAESQRNGGATTGTYCYCKLFNPSVAAAPWVYRANFGLNGQRPCPNSCASECSWRFNKDTQFRKNAFSARPQ